VKDRRGIIRGILPFLLSMMFLVLLASCDYARMREQESVRTYEKEMPRSDNRTVPIHSSFQALRAADPKQLANPYPMNAASIKQGKKAYTYFCIQCHGQKGDGMGTVGQSFSPLPSDLGSARVQGLSDGELYARIRLGYRRHPELYTTISEPDTWYVIQYARSLAVKE
jgi:mono/diheme cytochrome c family protein